MNPLSIIQKFRVTGIPSEAHSFGNGHINDTFKVVNADPGSPDYLLQKINHEVFLDVVGLMENIDKATNHIRKKEKERGHILTLIPTIDGELFFVNEQGYWRVFEFVKGGSSYEKAETPEMAYEGAKTYGKFLKELSDIPIENLQVTIPDFHNMRFRMQQFRTALTAAGSDRINQARAHIEYVQAIGSLMCETYDSSTRNIPLRVTHSDTKFNNVLFDTANKGICVVDLDTVMPGYVYYDIGDGVRTAVVTAEEDEADLDKVSVDIEKYKAYINGYLDATKEVLVPAELDYVSKAGPYMAFIMGLRFLTDFLAGDMYYKIKFPGHNLQRARCQLYVTRLLLDEMPVIEQLVKSKLR